MPIISTVGRRSLRMRLLIGSIYAVLIIGSVTMIYPFMIMVATSLSSQVDYREYRIIPRYFYNDDVLWMKYVAEKYGIDNFEDYRTKYGVDYYGYERIVEEDIMDVPHFSQITPEMAKRAEDWDEFKQELPSMYKDVYFVDPFRGGIVQIMYQQYLKKKYHKDIEAYNRKFNEHMEYFEDIDVIRERADGHKLKPEHTPLREEWEEFKATLPPKYLRVLYPENVFMPYLERKYDNDIQKLNADWGTNYKSFGEVFLPHNPPENPKIYKVWREFLQDTWPLRFIKLTGGDELYREFLKEKYGTVEAYNAHFRERKHISSFDEITLPKTFPEDDLEFQDWAEFVDNKLPGKYIRVVSAMSYYWDFLKKKYGTIDALNKAYGTSYKDFEEVRPPFREYDYIDFVTNKRAWKWYFLKSNYTKVMRFLVLRGRALYVTFLFVTGAILTQLTVMPLAAFALSRFKLPYTHRILLFLLATMAFPAEVSMIPNFLLMKELHLLNTLWALVLPGMANGFGIFLLKGFFDSLPAELYEAAYIEGASELQMFWHITVPMAKPILAVIALGAFTGAYGSFMWALIICQNPKWWTLMVWLYQFQHYNPPYIVMASLVVAAIPTLLVFIFCQNIILRGIIIPTFK